MLTDEFFAFMREREQIRLSRAAGLPREQWTQDPIFQKYKFTNVKREHDRTTRELLEGFYRGRESAGPAQRLVNCAMARFIGRAETVIEIGWRGVWDDDTFESVGDAIEARMGRGDKIFTGAYIIPNCGRSDDKHVVVLGILREVASWAYEDQDWFNRDQLTFRHFVETLCARVDGMGSFMAKEVLLDFILTSGWTPPDWNTWTPVGPGARRGAARVLSVDGSLDRTLNEKQALGVAKDLYDAYRQQSFDGTHEFWPSHWYPPDIAQSTATESQIPMVELCLADIQFQLCEFDKYMRVKTDSGKKPKTLFRPRSD